VDIFKNADPCSTTFEVGFFGLGNANAALEASRTMEMLGNRQPRWEACDCARAKPLDPKVSQLSSINLLISQSTSKTQTGFCGGMFSNSLSEAVICPLNDKYCQVAWYASPNSIS
jgi:hypothetical protein